MKDVLVGFNTNVIRAGRALHVQTEDSGRDRPHILTHLFADGTILASKKTEYGHLVGRPDLTDLVRALMKTQHKAMIRELRDGVHDAAATRVLGAARAPGPQPSTQDEAEPDAERRAGAPAAAPAPPAVPGASPPRAARPVDSGSAAARRDTGPRPSAFRERSGFGRDLISDRSLDEVILSYLAEELTKMQK